MTDTKARKATVKYIKQKRRRVRRVLAHGGSQDRASRSWRDYWAGRTNGRAGKAFAVDLRVPQCRVRAVAIRRAMNALRKGRPDGHERFEAAQGRP